QSNSLNLAMREAGMTVISDTFEENPKAGLQYLKNEDVRIIIGTFYPLAATKVYCELGMYGAKYAWFGTGWYGPDLIYGAMSGTSIDCTPEQIGEVIEGLFVVSDYELNPDTENVGISNLTPHEYITLYDEYVNYTGDSLVGYANSPYSYDTVWAIALALNTTMNDLKRSGDGEYVAVARYRAETDTVEMSHETTIIWIGTGPPNDEIEHVYITEKVPLYLYITMSVFAGVGILCAIVFLFFNIKFRYKRVIKMSSPTINNFILGGCIASYLSVFIENFEGSPQVDALLSCKMNTYLLMYGFSAAYGALFSKTWRVHIIFTNKHIIKKTIKDIQLVGLVLVLLSIDSIIIILWESLDPLEIHYYDAIKLPEEFDDRTVLYQVRLCESEHMSYWIGTLYSIKSVLLLFGVFLAWETRKVSIPILNDSRYIGICIYNVVILCGLGAPLVYALRFQSMMRYTITSTFVILATTVTQLLVFIPKLLTYREGHVMPTGTSGIRDQLFETSNFKATAVKEIVPTTNIGVQ
ncbi:gamma-aminobutyric acid type B receptor subunit 2-like, partial [Saccoglossus kowalevskii]